MTHIISNNDDVIDSRDVIARIEELEAEFDSAEISEDNGATPQRDDAGNVIVQLGTCGTCGKSWNDALISGSTPAPAGRCPYEGLHEELDELKALKALAEKAENYVSDWEHGATMIRESHFKEHAQELAEDIGAIKFDVSSQWPYTCIDWDKAARELKMDYTEVDYDGVTYLVR